MQRRLFLSGSAAAALALVGCGGGGTSTATDTAIGVTAQRLGTTGVGGALPSSVLACYFTAFDTRGFRMTDVPQDFNVVNLFHAKPDANVTDGNWNNAGNGAFAFQHHGEVPAADVQACRARGQKVMLTVGGANAGYNFDSRAKSQNFIASFQDMHARLGGVDGCDFNNFEAGIGSSAAEMIWIAQQLKALYGPDFAITAPPQPNSPEDRAMLKAMAGAGVLSWAAPQYYDWPGFNAPGFIADRTNDWVADLGPSQVVVGLSANYANGPSLEDCIREFSAVKAAHPGIRGAFCWSAQLNLQGGNAWGSAMRRLV